MLELLGIQLLQGPEREAWQRTAQEAADAIAGTGNQWLGDPATRDDGDHPATLYWLVVWNIFIFPYIGNNHPEELKLPTSIR